MQKKVITCVMCLRPATIYWDGDYFCDMDAMHTNVPEDEQIVMADGSPFVEHR